MKYKAWVIVSWQGTGTAKDPYRPIVPWAVDSTTDVTSQPSANLTPSPNSLTVEVVCSPEVLATIPAGVILWSEPIEEVKI